MDKAEFKKKVCPGGRIDVETGDILVVEVCVKTNKCKQADDCRFHNCREGFECSHYK
jgi:hypothetical protein